MKYTIHWGCPHDYGNPRMSIVRHPDTALLERSGRNHLTANARAAMALGEKSAAQRRSFHSWDVIAHPITNSCPNKITQFCR